MIKALLPVAGGECLDKRLGDPAWLPHPVVAFGKAASFVERKYNKGGHRKARGAVCGVCLVMLTYGLVWGMLAASSFVPFLPEVLGMVGVFYGLAGKTLCEEVKKVFQAVDRSPEEGRRQVARIVGRDTSSLTPQEVRTAALETLSENLSDGVIAPLFWYFVLGLPGMMAYKMVNTLDSMWGYKTARFRDFGCWSARMDDVANYLPARLTALLMLLSAQRLTLWKFVRKYGRAHASPNSGYPESALAGILDCRFGGPHSYFGVVVDKPFIGSTDRLLTANDMQKALRINQLSEWLMAGLMLIAYLLMAVFR